MRKLYIDLMPIQSGGINGGAKKFILDLTYKLRTIKPYLDIICVINKDMKPEEIFTNKDEFRWLTKGRFNRILIGDKKRDVFFSPFGASSLITNHLKRISICYDFLHEKYPNLFTYKEYKARRKNIYNIKKNSDITVCISNHTKKEAVERGFPEERLKHIPISVEYTPRQIYDQENHDIRLLYPANTWPHKNHEMLFAAMKYLQMDTEFPSFKLICTGYSTKERQKELNDLINGLGLSSIIDMKGYLTREEMERELVNMTMLIFPSLYEGFGIPVLEAMIFNKPICCSNIGTLKEVAEKAAYRFDPRNPKAISAAIKKVCVDRSIREELIRQGNIQRIKYSNHTQMVYNYIESFENLLGNHG